MRFKRSTVLSGNYFLAPSKCGLTFVCCLHLNRPHECTSMTLQERVARSSETVRNFRFLSSCQNLQWKLETP